MGITHLHATDQPGGHLDGPSAREPARRPAHFRLLADIHKLRRATSRIRGHARRRHDRPRRPAIAPCAGSSHPQATVRRWVADGAQRGRSCPPSRQAELAPHSIGFDRATLTFRRHCPGRPAAARRGNPRRAARTDRPRRVTRRGAVDRSRDARLRPRGSLVTRVAHWAPPRPRSPTASALHLRRPLPTARSICASSASPAPASRPAPPRSPSPSPAYRRSSKLAVPDCGAFTLRADAAVAPVRRRSDRITQPGPSSWTHPSPRSPSTAVSTAERAIINLWYRNPDGVPFVDRHRAPPLRGGVRSGWACPDAQPEPSHRLAALVARPAGPVRARADRPHRVRRPTARDQRRPGGGGSACPVLSPARHICSRSPLRASTRALATWRSSTSCRWHAW